MNEWRKDYLASPVACSAPTLERKLKKSLGQDVALSKFKMMWQKENQKQLYKVHGDTLSNDRQVLGVDVTVLANLNKNQINKGLDFSRYRPSLQTGRTRQKR